MKDLNLFEMICIETEGLTVYGTAEDPMFVAKDISDILGYVRAKDMMRLVNPEFVIKLMVKRDYEVKNEKEVENDDALKKRPVKSKNDEVLKMTHVKSKTFNKPYEVLMLTEYGLYQVLFRSNHPIAVEFTNKVMRLIKQMRLNTIEEYRIKLDESNEYKTVSGYLLSKGLNPKDFSLTSIGKHCTKLSAANNYEVKKIEHKTYGFINSYKISVIETVLNRLEEK